MQDDLSYSGIYPIRAHEINQEKQLTVPALMQLMQEASMHNAIQLKASVWDLESLKISWILLRKEIVIKAILPSLGDSIKILTYPAGFDRVFAYRDFKAYDMNDKLIAYASSTWTLMHTEKRTMVRIPTDIFDFDAALFHKLLPHPPNKLPRLNTVDYEVKYQVGYYDLDWNGHVNNIFLTRCMLEGIPDRYLQEGKLQKFTIHFKTESLWKDQLSVQFESKEAQTSLHKIVRANDQKTIATGLISWF